MTLSPGTRLGSYEILAQLGAGGMGEVYRAKDLRIDRAVALKVLPEEFFEDEERRARFEREARTLASLNHPGIALLYSFEESGRRNLLVMELVEGEGLDQKICAGPLPLEDTVSYARQLAEALAAAHEKGIVHRDLKPANVMVTKDGRAKILDFGLAKVGGSGESAKADTTLPTDMKTQEGVVMGTVPYMSPEQVSGRPLDHRTDIFSLGVILYEMATGQRPFRGDSSAELVSSILRDTPRPPGELRKGLPGNLERTVQRCLEKSAADRVQSARQVLDGLSSVTPQAPATAAATPASRPAPAPDSGAARVDEGFWVAVLPFRYGGTDASLTALAEGLTEEIVTGLSRFSYLRVIARAATARLASGAADVRTVAREIGARYVMEGSLRQAGTRLRLAVQLVDALSGAHLWAENFERTFGPDSVFELQDDLAPRIVSTVADMYGVLSRSMNEALRGKADEELSPHEAVLSAFGYMERVTPEEHARVRRILERAVSIAPNQSDAWAMLANLYWEEHAHGLNPQPDPLGRALAAARRAVEAAPSNNLAHYALASTLFFRKDFLAFRLAAERAIELNRMDASVAAFIGNLVAYAGDWERGCALVESAMQLNPRHPGWYWFVNFNDAYRRRDYRGALGFALKFNQPGNFYTHAVIAMAYGQLGMREAAGKALQELLAIRPDFAKTAREEFGRWFHDLAFIEHQLDGLRKAGLPIAPDGESAKHESGPARAEDGFWVAVLPFKYAGANAELKGLADGLSEEIVTGLSRFSYLRVIARGSTVKYSSESGDVRAIGKELGARYVMEGSLRQAGTKLRVAVQLVDAVSGAHLWAENYERTFSPEAVFELQDDLVPRIVSTVADTHGVLPRSMSGELRSRAPEQLSPYEAVLRSFGYFERVTAEELAAARSGLELAVQKAPGFADAWAMLALLCVQEHAQGFNLQADSLTSGSTAARRAVEAAPSNHLAHFSLAQALFFQKEFQSFRNAAERAIALNPMDGNSIAFLGELLTYAGDRERGLALAGRAKQLNPSHPGWYWYADFYNAYRQGDDRNAISFLLKADLPGHWGSHAAMAAACGQLGERDAAARAVRDLLKLRPDFAATVRKEFEKWWDPEYVERFIDGLRKAGLAVPSSARVDPARS